MNNNYTEDNFENQLAVLMLEALEKKGVLSVSSKKLLEEYIWKEGKDASKKSA